jgi:hypothetical protein
MFLLKPALALPALEASEAAYGVMGGRGALQLQRILAEVYHEGGNYDRELRTVVEAQRKFPNESILRGRSLRAYAGSKDPASALALADLLLGDTNDSIGAMASQVTTASQEFRADGDVATATRLLSLVTAWYERRSASPPTPALRFSEGVALLMGGKGDSAAVRFALLARDTTRIDAAGYLGLADVVRGDRAAARAVADSLGRLKRPWLFGTNTYWRGAILGALGDKALAVELLRQAASEGQTLQAWHFATALDSLHGYPPFEALIRPER